MPVIPVIAVVIAEWATFVGASWGTAMTIGTWVATIAVYGAVSAGLSLASSLLANKPSGQNSYNDPGLSIYPRCGTGVHEVLL